MIRNHCNISFGYVFQLSLGDYSMCHFMGEWISEYSLNAVRILISIFCTIFDFFNQKKIHSQRVLLVFLFTQTHAYTFLLSSKQASNTFDHHMKSITSRFICQKTSRFSMAMGRERETEIETHRIGITWHGIEVNVSRYETKL